MNKIRIPQGAQSIIDTLKAAGYEAYVVGGCVRDSMLGLDPKDWDICTSAVPSQILYSFRDKRVIETGLKHGTVTVVMDDGQYEVNIDLRREIATKCKENQYVKGMFDFRMRLTDAQHYAAAWDNQKMVEDFIKSIVNQSCEWWTGNTRLPRSPRPDSVAALQV